MVVSRQLRSSGGIWIQYGETTFHLDPGPGALIKALSSRPRLNPSSLDALLLSHRHLDHANDLNIMTEAMTNGTTRKRGRVFLPPDALGGEPVLQSYLRQAVEGIYILQEKETYTVKGVSFTTPMRHIHPVDTYGFRFSFPGETISFITDTLYHADLLEAYSDSDVLVINTVRLERGSFPGLAHLTVPDAEEIIKNIQPRCAILTHFGMTVLHNKPWEITAALSDRLGIQVVAAKDGMTLSLPYES